jgi:hypothetical protein
LRLFVSAEPRSLPSLALNELLEQASSFRTSLDRLEAGENLDRAEAQNSLERLLDASQALRDSLFSMDQAARWHGQQELRELIERLESRELRRYEELAELLAAGTIEHRSKRTEAERRKLRDGVVAELRAIHAQHHPPELPGPSIESWLAWAWALEDGCEVLQLLESSLPQLEEFLRTVEPEWWQPGLQLPNDYRPVLPRLTAEAQAGEPVVAVESPASEPEADSRNRKQAINIEAIGFDATQSVEAETEVLSEEAADPEPFLSESLSGELPLSGESELIKTTAWDEAPSSEEALIAVEIAPSSPPLAVNLEGVTSNSSMSPASLNEQSSRRKQPQPSDIRERSVTTEALVSFETYRAEHFAGRQGLSELAPWHLPTFNARLRQLIKDCLQSDSLPQLLLAVRAAEVAKLPNLLDSDAVRHVAYLLRYGQLQTDARETLWQRWEAVLLSELHDDLQLESGFVGVKLLACIHGFSCKVPLSVSNLLGGGDFVSIQNGALRAAFELFRQRSLTTHQWVEHLRDRLDSNQLDRRETLEARIRQARQQLRTTVQDRRVLRNLVTSHCREAWASFLSKTAKERSALLLDLPRDWKTAPEPEAIERWATVYQRTMEHEGAKYIDRKNMDGAFDELSSQALTLSQMLRAWNKGSESSIPSREAESAEIGQLNSLFNSEPLEDAEEELCRLVARAALRGQTLPKVCLELTLKDIFERPLLMEFLDELPGPQVRGELPALSWAVVKVDDLAEPLRVAARLLEPVELLPEDAEVSAAGLQQALSRLGRTDLEDRFITWMDESEKRKCWNDRRLQVEELERSSLRMSELGAQLSDLTDQRADAIRGFGLSLHAVSDRVGRPGLELALLKAWAIWIIDSSSGFVNERAEDLRHRSSGNDAVLQALDRKDYWLATAPVDGLGRHRSTRLRETVFRSEGQRQFVDPRLHLREIADSTETSPIEKRAAQLAGAWLRATLRSDAANKKLRVAFLEFVFQARLNTSRLLDCFEHRNNAPFRSSLNCDSIRIALAQEGVNPSYLPQLADIRKLQLILPENITVSGIENPTKALSDDLCVVLAPNVTQTTRRDVRQHAKSRMVAVLDDLDLCRLLDLRRSTEVAPLLGLFEIVLEQQRWERVDPYQTQDGQLIRMEMFVGRMEEGERLALSNDYKKLFSGRKLGKSALLRYVQDRFDKKELPSGNELRVIYLSLVDHFHENDFVECLIEGIEKACGWKVPNALRHQDGGWPMLREVIRELLDEKPKLSLLIVADEADKFVRQELDRYRKVQEECLSFRLRSELEQVTDSRQLPRIRFLFAGYRETNRSEGAWSNWGSTLRLSPLDPGDATSLLAGPLARLGIDLGDMAATVAYRCGFQPAVLFQAGKALLTRMDKQRQIDTSWENIKVRPIDVTAVLEDSSIRDEIRQVINNNFSQNKLGQIVFHAVAILLADRPFGYALEHPEQQVRVKLLESDPSEEFRTWLMADERSTSASILMELEELQQRKLLVEDPGPPAGYRLAFPHHVAALGGTQQLITILQQQMRDLPVGTLTSSTGGPLSFFAADEVNRLQRDLKDYASEPKASRLVRAVLAVSHWTEPRDRNPVLHPSCGILALLGCTQERRMFTADDAKASIARSDQLLLLPGGADLLRWALNEACDDFVYDYAAVRRLGLEDLRAWFERLYEIEVTPQQLVQMATRTGGIPLLVGELHRLIVPDGSEPPDKLHEGSWKKVQADFALNLPSLSRQLRDGGPAIRLTEREIEILKMVSLAAQYAATSQQLVYDLTEGWGFYDRPDLRPIELDDEARVTLLQDLGLLPMHRAYGLRAVEALVPFEATDPLHTLLQHLDS